MFVICYSYLLTFVIYLDAKCWSCLTTINSSLWLINNTNIFCLCPAEFYKQITKLCDVFRQQELNILWFGNTYNVQIYTARQVEKLVRSYEFLEKSSRYDFLHRWLGLGLLTRYVWYIIHWYGGGYNDDKT